MNSFQLYFLEVLKIDFDFLCLSCNYTSGCVPFWSLKSLWGKILIVRPIKLYKLLILFDILVGCYSYYNFQNAIINSTTHIVHACFIKRKFSNGNFQHKSQCWGHVTSNNQNWLTFYALHKGYFLLVFFQLIMFTQDIHFRIEFPIFHLRYGYIE